MQAIIDVFGSGDTWAIIGGMVSLVSLVAIPITLSWQQRQNYKSYNSREFKDMEVALHTLFEYALRLADLQTNAMNGPKGLTYQNEMNESARKVIVLLRVVSEREKDKVIAGKLKWYLKLFVEKYNNQTFFYDRQILLDEFANLREAIR